MIVVIASTNPAKINAVKTAFTQVFPNDTWTFEGVKTASGVSDQPKSSAETLSGAKNRVESAYAARPDADYWVGIEGGVDITPLGMAETPWVVVRGPGEVYGYGRPGMFLLPTKISDLINEGKDLAEAADTVFNYHDARSSVGAVGLLTNGHIDRAAYSASGVIFALVPFLHPELY